MKVEGLQRLQNGSSTNSAAAAQHGHDADDAIHAGRLIECLSDEII
jgi:hypothetical protein